MTTDAEDLTWLQGDVPGMVEHLHQLADHGAVPGDSDDRRLVMRISALTWIDAINRHNEDMPGSVKSQRTVAVLDALRQALDGAW